MSLKYAVFTTAIQLRNINVKESISLLVFLSGEKRLLSKEMSYLFGQKSLFTFYHFTKTESKLNWTGNIYAHNTDFMINSKELHNVYKLLFKTVKVSVGCTGNVM